MSRTFFYYTKEHDDFLRANYPVYGGKKTTELFNERFNLNKKQGTIASRCVYTLGLNISDERMKIIHKNVHYLKGVPMGTISSGTYEAPAVRTENGWERIDRQIVGKIEPDEVIIHLDMDKNNNDPNNLMVVKKSITSRMAKNHFWSENPEITKTGIIWCQLDLALSQTGFSRNHRLRDREAYNRRMPKPKLHITEKKPSDSASGEYYIHQRKETGNWIVQIHNRYIHFSHEYKSYDKAIQVRDMLLNGIKKMYKNGG